MANNDNEQTAMGGIEPSGGPFCAEAIIDPE